MTRAHPYAVSDGQVNDDALDAFLAAGDAALSSFVRSHTDPDRALAGFGTTAGPPRTTPAAASTDEVELSADDLRLLAQIATGVTADIAARRLRLSARTLRRRLRVICARLGVNTPIEAVVWAARRQLI